MDYTNKYHSDSMAPTQNMQNTSQASTSSSSSRHTKEQQQILIQAFEAGLGLPRGQCGNYDTLMSDCLSKTNLTKKQVQSFIRKRRFNLKQQEEQEENMDGADEDSAHGSGRHVYFAELKRKFNGGDSKIN